MDPVPMHCLVYTSGASRPMGDDDLSELLETCRARNLADGITGMLLYKDGSFMQALEGPRDVVFNTYARIVEDPRHKDVFLLLDRPVPQRNFDGWAMGFRTVAAEDLAGVAGFDDLSGGDLAAPALASKPHIALRLLTRFNENTR
ncbi:BLUF domain-containing protein [Sulfitobacter sp. D35]|uniref:BLUF domain-containing protein n=1 Tax=Sulfitobacter sp. D35 TaxID=3083252 RepID=UPI00296EC0C1|nr:BLUF domain-containing protein [Sulfitobacter sp. D35]MDW4498509.1 BLUF domain-containing protein [Sulfitobacter sp. D35]